MTEFIPVFQSRLLFQEAFDLRSPLTSAQWTKPEQDVEPETAERSSIYFNCIIFQQWHVGAIALMIQVRCPS